MKREPEFYFDENEGISYCAIGTKADDVFVGTAKCHPDDRDFMSEKTGCEIALRRAEIEALRSYRNELKIGLAALKQLYYSINHSKNFNPKSYEAKMLFRQINQKVEDIDTVKEIIKERKQELKKLIDDKDTFYRTTRKHRENLKSMKEDNKDNTY